jgi:hypothetical protein
MDTTKKEPLSEPPVYPQIHYFPEEWENVYSCQEDLDKACAAFAEAVHEDVIAFAEARDLSQRLLFLEG